MNLNYVAGFLPAIIYPAATLLQIIRILRDRSAAGISKTTWLLFGIANIAMYIYAERYWEWQAIVSLLLSAVFDFVILALGLVAVRASTVGRERAVHFERVDAENH